MTNWYFMKFARFLYFTIRCFQSSASYEISARRARPIILELQKYKCLMCDQKFSKHIPHEIHHIDHNTTNNTLHNFAALCCNCHHAHHRYNISFPIEKYQKLLLTLKS